MRLTPAFASKAYRNVWFRDNRLVNKDGQPVASVVRGFPPDYIGEARTLAFEKGGRVYLINENAPNYLRRGLQGNIQPVPSRIKPDSKASYLYVALPLPGYEGIGYAPWEI